MLFPPFSQPHQADEEGKYPRETLLGYAAISTMSSQQLSISSLSWVITRMVLPFRASLFNLSAIRRMFRPSRPLIRHACRKKTAFTCRCRLSLDIHCQEVCGTRCLIVYAQGNICVCARSRVSIYHFPVAVRD